MKVEELLDGVRRRGYTLVSQGENRQIKPSDVGEVR